MQEASTMPAEDFWHSVANATGLAVLRPCHRQFYESPGGSVAGSESQGRRVAFLYLLGKAFQKSLLPPLVSCLVRVSRRDRTHQIGVVIPLTILER